MAWFLGCIRYVTRATEWSMGQWSTGQDETGDTETETTDNITSLPCMA